MAAKVGRWLEDAGNSYSLLYAQNREDKLETRPRLNLKSHDQGHTSCSEGTPAKVPQTAPATGEQGFKVSRLWGTFLIPSTTFVLGLEIELAVTVCV